MVGEGGGESSRERLGMARESGEEITLNGCCSLAGIYVAFQLFPHECLE